MIRDDARAARTCARPRLLHRLGVPYERVSTFAAPQYFSLDQARSPEIKYTFSRSTRQATKPKRPQPKKLHC